MFGNSLKEWLKIKRNKKQKEKMKITDVLKYKEQEFKRLSEERDVLKSQMQSPLTLKENLDKINRLDKELEFLQSMQDSAEDSNDQDYESNLEKFKELYKDELNNASTKDEKRDMAFMLSTVETLWHEKSILSEQIKQDSSARESEVAEQTQQSQQDQEMEGFIPEVEKQRQQQRQQQRQEQEKQVQKDDHDRDDKNDDDDNHGDTEMPSFLDDID